jgi:hypothetical protein
MHNHSRPLIVQYLYVHAPGEAFSYPSARSHASAARVACRYLECAVAQAASLRLRDAACDLALVTNVEDRQTLGREGAELLERLDTLGVQLLHADYQRRPPGDSEVFMASRYVLDAILAAVEGQPTGRQLWLSDLDCVWPNAELMFASAPGGDLISAIESPYGIDWPVADSAAVGRTRREIGELALELRAVEDDETAAQAPARDALAVSSPPWIGGELLSGTPEALRALVATCDALDERLARLDLALPTEEQLLTLAGALDMVRYHDLHGVARRIWTGPRHGAPEIDEPLRLGLWHLPAEKGLSLRRTAREACSGRTRRLRADLADPSLMARRFNVQGNGVLRRLRDDGWLARQRLQDTVRSLLGGREQSERT